MMPNPKCPACFMPAHGNILIDTDKNVLQTSAFQCRIFRWWFHAIRAHTRRTVRRSAVKRVIDPSADSESCTPVSGP